MGINHFKLINCRGVKYAESQDVPQFMIIAGPIGVGKSTLLEQLSFMMKGMYTNDCDINFDQNSKPIYFGAHRSPQHLQVNKFTPMIMKAESKNAGDDYFDRMGNSYDGFDTKFQVIPDTIKSHSWRTATSADYVPYFEVKRTLIELETDSREIIYNEFKNNGEIKNRETYDLSGPINQIVEQFFSHIRFKEITLDDKGQYNINFVNNEGHIIEFDFLSSGEKEIISFFFPLIFYKIKKQIKDLPKEPKPSLDLVYLIDNS